MRFIDKKAVVTGANRGLGFTLARQFLEEGAEVYALVREKNRFSTEGIEHYAEKLHVLECDLENEESIAAATKELRKFTKNIDILVNNAGVLIPGTFSMMSMDLIRKVYEVNVFGTMAITQKLLRLMIKKGGAIINISSMMDSSYEQGISIYASTKAAISSWTKTLAKELGSFGIRVNAVCPGNMDTDMIRNAESREAVQAMVDHQIIPRLAKTEEVAKAVLFAASEEASFMTGSLLRVDGGYYG